MSGAAEKEEMVSLYRAILAQEVIIEKLCERMTALEKAVKSREYK